MTARVGPYQVVREVARPPGAILLEVRDKNDQRRLLQSTCFRPVTDKEFPERQRIEREIAHQTTKLLSNDSDLHAHGGTDGDRDERILFWALSFCDAPSLAQPDDLTVSDLLEVAIHLAKRMIDRHDRAAWDPLLSEHFVRVDRASKAIQVIGVPLAIPVAWISTSVTKTRLAPEESDVAGSVSGDIWRLGKLLLSVADHLEVPTNVRDCFESLARPNPDKRVASATLALEMLSEVVPDPDNEKTTKLEENMLPEFSQEEKTEREQPPDLDPTVVDPLDEAQTAVEEPRTPIPSSALAVWDIPEPEAVEAVTHKSEPETPVPTPEVQDPSLASDTVVEETVRPIHVAVVKTIDPNLKSRPDEITDNEGKPTTQGTRKGNGTDASFDALAASWNQPELPAGESPWSEVVIPRGTHRRASAPFPGIEDEIPVPSETRPASGGNLKPYTSVDSGEIDAEIAATISGFNARRVVGGVLALLVIFGFFALISRSGSQRIETLDVVVVPPANSIQLESSPPGATVIAEADGMVLGKTPLEFLVPTGANAALYLKMEGFIPLRLALPERGAFKATLERMTEPALCTIRLSSPNNAGLEGIDFDFDGGTEAIVRGASLIRSKPGEPNQGVRMLLCPELGGLTEQHIRLPKRLAVAKVRVTQPVGFSAYLGGDPIGPVPAHAAATGSFSRIRVGDTSGMTEERWVPTVVDTEVHMPTPKQRRIPILVVPSTAEPEEEVEIEESKKPNDRTKRLMKSGMTHLLRGRTNTAKARFFECLKLDPENAACHRGLGTLYRRIHRKKKSQEHFRRYLQLTPDAPDAERIKQLIAG